MIRPYLLLDVDGVLCPFYEQPGYQFIPDLDSFVSEANKDALERLREVYDLVWATSWEHKANDYLAEFHGLDPLPVIEFHEQFSRYETPKLYDIIEFVGERSFAWVDDDIRWDAEEYAANRETPTLFVQTDPTVGLTPGDVEQLFEFVRLFPDSTSCNSDPVDGK